MSEPGTRSDAERRLPGERRVAGVDFEWLERDPDYHRRALARPPALSNFVGTFEQAHAEGFIDDIRGAADAILTGSFADSNFKRHSFPHRRLPLGPLGSVDLPVTGRIVERTRTADGTVCEDCAWLSTNSASITGGSDGRTTTRSVSERAPHLLLPAMIAACRQRSVTAPTRRRTNSQERNGGASCGCDVSRHVVAGGRKQNGISHTGWAKCADWRALELSDSVRDQTCQLF